MCHGLPSILMSVICTMLMPFIPSLYHGTFPVYLLIVLFLKVFKFNISVVHLCQDCKKSPGENILLWFTRLDSRFTFDLLCFEERNWLDISCTEKDEPQILCEKMLLWNSLFSRASITATSRSHGVMQPF